MLPITCVFLTCVGWDCYFEPLTHCSPQDIAGLIRGGNFEDPEARVSLLAGWRNAGWEGNNRRVCVLSLFPDVLSTADLRRLGLSRSNKQLDDWQRNVWQRFAGASSWLISRCSVCQVDGFPQLGSDPGLGRQIAGTDAAACGQR